MSARRAPPRGIAFGGDNSPEQWPRETWAEDVRLMAETPPVRDLAPGDVAFVREVDG